MPEWVYVGLGSNLGDRKATLLSAVKEIERLPSVYDLKVSSFYETKPVSDLPQRWFLNGVCRFQTCDEPGVLFAQLEQIERDLGKVPKPKNAPRVIDLDLLFFGTREFVSGGLVVPHPRWWERLFVLAPLADLTQFVGSPPFDLYKYLEKFGIEKERCVQL